MKKIIRVLMIITPFMTLLGGYISCSDIYYEAHLKAGVTFVLFLQLGIYFFQGLLCRFANMSNKINLISVSGSLIGSLIIMLIYDFLGIDIMILLLLLCTGMYLLGYKSYELFHRLISKVKRILD